MDPLGDYGTVDDAALTVGLGLVLLGSAVFGFFETLLGSIHVSRRISGIGVVVFHTSFSPHLRAYTIALGFFVLLTWGISRIGGAAVT